MIPRKKPYFLENEEWYTVDLDFQAEDGRGYHLTDKAPQEAIDSYLEFYGDKSVEIEGKVYTVSS